MNPARLPVTLRVESVMRAWPDVELLAPLRALVMTTSRAQPGDATFVTVGKRLAQPSHLAELVPRAVERFATHLTEVIGHALAVLDAQARGDADGAVRALLAASRAESLAGRESEALLWLDQALVLATLGADRGAELEVLRALAEHRLAARDFGAAARHAQRAFTVAEAVGATDHAARAALLLGTISCALGAPDGAHAWLARAHECAAAHPSLLARALLGQCEVDTARGELEAAAAALAAATALLRDASGALPTSEVPQVLGEDPADLDAPPALLLARAEARLALRSGRPDEAVAQYRLALVVALRGRKDARLGLRVRIELSRSLLGLSRLADAEDEARLAEEHAIVHGRPRELAELYLILGEIRGRQRDEGGFVFFEQAIALAQDSAPTPRLEAEAFQRYARFRDAFGEHEEARTYVGRARQLLVASDDDNAVAALDAEWLLSEAAR